MRYVLPLEGCQSSSLPAVGGKAVGLWELLRRGLPVPPGFVVTTEAYRDFVASEGLERELRRWLEYAQQSVEAQLEASGQIRELFTGRQPPSFLVEEVAGAYARLGEPPVAVRSSAVGEDAKTASFAGEHESFLWVCGAGEVARAVLRCWASLFSPQALSYFAHLGYSPAEAAMGVVVQHMVDAKAAGVMITLDPVTGDPSQVTVEATYGLGLAVVGGEVTPDRFAVDKVTLEVRGVRVGTKSVAYRYDPTWGRVVAAPVAEAEAQRPCLSEHQVQELARMGRQLERELGRAQDVEWAMDAQGRFFLVQTRPETVWSNRPRAPLADPEEPVLSRILRNIRIPMRIAD